MKHQTSCVEDSFCWNPIKNLLCSTPSPIAFNPHNQYTLSTSRCKLQWADTKSMLLS